MHEGTDRNNCLVEDEFTDKLTLDWFEVKCLMSLMLKTYKGFVLVDVDARPINQRIGDLFNVQATWKRLKLTLGGHPIYQEIFDDAGKNKGSDAPVEGGDG